MSGGPVWWPIGHKHVTGFDAVGIRHAVPIGDAMRGGQFCEDVVAVCGAGLDRLAAFTAVSDDGTRKGVSVAEWPPFAGVGDRCRACFEATGRPRVHQSSGWRR